MIFLPRFVNNNAVINSRPGLFRISVFVIVRRFNASNIKDDCKNVANRANKRVNISIARGTLMVYSLINIDAYNPNNE
jgi:hypothetical protein